LIHFNLYLPFNEKNNYSGHFISCNYFSKAQIKILFDATKAEMAGNGDWVIDADLHNLKANSMELSLLADRIPIPKNSHSGTKWYRQVRPKLIGPVL
jgi:hypothetical protein